MVTEPLLYSFCSSTSTPPPPPPLCSLPLPAHAAALRAVDGGGWGAALRLAGERRDVSAGPCLCALRPVLHGGGRRRAAGAGVRPGLHASRPGSAGQIVSRSWNHRVVVFLASRWSVGHLWDAVELLDWFQTVCRVWCVQHNTGLCHFMYAATIVVGKFTKLLVCLFFLMYFY